MSKVELVHFVVEGEFITDLARRLWSEEDAQEKALNLLKTLVGITDAQCLDILEGRAKLTGTSGDEGGIALEPDTATGTSLKDTLAKLRRERDEARDEREDLAQLAAGDTVIAASPTGAREIPRRKAKRWLGGDGAIGGGTGYVAPGYEFDDVLADPRRDHVYPEGTKPLRIWRQMRDRTDPRRARADILGRIEKEAIEPVPEKPAMPKSFDEIMTDTGWLSPEGEFYPCQYGNHASTAWALHENGVEIAPAGDDSWVRLCHDDRQHFFGEPALFTQKQNELIAARCKELGIALPYWFEK